MSFQLANTLSRIVLGTFLYLLASLAVATAAQGADCTMQSMAYAAAGTPENAAAYIACLTGPGAISATGDNIVGQVATNCPGSGDPVIGPGVPGHPNGMQILEALLEFKTQYGIDDSQWTNFMNETTAVPDAGPVSFDGTFLNTQPQYFDPLAPSSRFGASMTNEYLSLERPYFQSYEIYPEVNQ